MVQLQILNKVLADKSDSILKSNSITAEYFTEYPDEYSFLRNHIDNYACVPDIETFVAKFPDFEVLTVNESERYLVDTIREEFLYTRSVPIIKKAAELLKGDANEAAQYLQSELLNLTPNYSIPSVDILHSDERLEVFKDKSNNKDSWFIPTGFQELDDIIGGWQCGEELIVIFARTGIGKSWVAVKSMQHAAAIGKNVGYISPEMSAVKIGYRFDTVNKHFSNSALVKGDIDNLDVSEYASYIQELGTKNNKFLVSTPRDFNNKITVSKVRNFVVSNDLDVIAIDGISYMTDERYKKGDNLTTALKNISEDLMTMSCELQIPVIIVVQSNRGGVDKDTPDLEDIRDSDGISHNATKVISLNQKDAGLIMKIKKNRDGKNGDKLTYIWDIDKGEFVWMSSDEDSASTEHKEENKEEIKSAYKENKKVVF